MFKQIYQDSYDMCVTKLENDNKISVSVAGYEVCAMIDTGSTISVISSDLFHKMKQATKVSVKKCDKQCMVANGSNINLDTIVSVPVKIGKVTFIADLYVLKIEHYTMIIGCDLLKNLRAKIDFEYKHVVINKQCRNTQTGAVLGVIISVDNNVKLKPRVEKIHLAESDTNEDQKQQLIKLMNKYEMCFANNLMELGRTSLIEYDIETVRDIKPIRMKPYRCAYKHREVIYEEIDKLSEAGLIRPAIMSQWGFPTVLVSKPHSSKMRMCNDVRKLNDQTILQPYPILNMNFLLADIGKRQCKYFSIIDLSDSYRQIPLSKRSQEIATMSTIVGDFSPVTCIFGLKNLPFVFTKLMDRVFSSIRGKFVDFFLDDIIVYSANFKDHIDHIEEVMIRLQRAQLTAKPVKTFLCKKKVQYLGYMISKDGITTTEENIEKIKNFPKPKKVKDVRSFIGLTTFYKKLIRGFSNWSKELIKLTTKQSVPFVWTDKANEAFETLKKKLISAPILAFPDMNSKEPLIVTVDTSSHGIGYVLSQRQMSDINGKLVERPICYGSTHLRGAQKKMGSTDLELTGVCFALKKLDCWIRGVKFILITDNKSLTFLVNKQLDEIKPTIARKIIFLQQYNFDIIHKEGKKIAHVDALSRYVSKSCDDEEEDIEPVINNIGEIQEKCNGPLDISGMGLEKLTLEKVRQLQKHDVFYSAMYHYLQNGHIPINKALARKLRSNKDVYIIDNKLLYHLWNKRSDKNMYKQLCIPNELRSQILSVLHDTKFTGHRGVFKMYEHALKKVWWNKMYRDIQNYVSSCRLCMETNTGHLPNIPLNPLDIPDGPFHTIHVDLLKFHTPSKGFNYILVIIDSFSKFVITKAIRNKTAKNVIKAICEEFILKFGICKHLSIMSDNGNEFISGWSKTLYKLLGVKSIGTSVYKPSSNGLVERMNRTIVGILRGFVKDYPNGWSQDLACVTYVINTSVSESAGYTPFNLIFGVEATGVLDLCFPDKPDNVPGNLEHAYRCWIGNLDLLRRLAGENNVRAKEIQRLRYDRHTKPHELKVGDRVFIGVHRVNGHEDMKLRQQFRGIYTIVSFLSPTNVILCDGNGAQLSRSVYINNIKKYKDRKMYSTSEDQPDRLEDSDEAQSDDENVSLSGQSESENTAQQPYNACGVDHDVEDQARPPHDDGGVDHEIERDTQEQPLLDKSEDDGDDRDHSDDGGGIVDLPFSDLDDESLRDTMEDPEDTTQSQNKPMIENNRYEGIRKVYRKRVLPCGGVEYYLSWAKCPTKKHKCWVKREDLSPALQDYVDTRKLPCTYK